MIRSITDQGFTLYGDDSHVAGTNILGFGFSYEAHIRDEIQRSIPKVELFLDIGANHGIHTLNAKRFKPGVKVAAFEVAPANTRILCQNIHANKLEDVVVYNVALADDYRLVQKNQDIYNPSCLSKEHVGCEWVQAFPLDCFFLPGRVGLIKMDVEGFEPLVFQGAANLIGCDRPVIIFEFFPQAIAQNANIEPKSFLETVIEAGYRLTVLNDRKPCGQNAQAVLDHMGSTTIIDILALPTFPI